VNAGDDVKVGDVVIILEAMKMENEITSNRDGKVAEVRVKDGDTVVIGGLTHQNEFERISRIPILGYIPVVNLLFMDKKKIVEETEVVVFITPTILSDGISQGQRIEKIQEIEKTQEVEEGEKIEKTE